MTANKNKQAYHDRQTSAGRVLVQTYLDRELRERLDLIARKRGVPLWHLFAEMVEDFCDRTERDEADALRRFFANEILHPTAVAT